MRRNPMQIMADRARQAAARGEMSATRKVDRPGTGGVLGGGRVVAGVLVLWFRPGSTVDGPDVVRR